MTENLFDLAEAWLDHCKAQAELAGMSGFTDEAEKWNEQIEIAQIIIKDAMDREVQV